MNDNLSEVQEARKLLIVEDDEGLQKQLRWSFENYEVLVADDRESALGQLRRHEPAVVTLDLGLPPDPANATEGLATLEEILAFAPDTKVIVVTGNDERENALQAINAGAFDFYQKPIDADILGIIIERAFGVYDIEQENRQLNEMQLPSTLNGLIAASPNMLNVCRTIEKVAPSDATVLLLGESGTGKEVMARSLHEQSSRRKKNFVAINCAAIPENLLESELFGYEKGAFTGANKQTRGKIEYANGGTFFLDEVGDLPMALQGKLLRFLQERVIERIGGREEIPVDIRIICATHKALEDLIPAGQFREDLFYRISEISINIPPLRERGSDAVLIARAIIARQSQQAGIQAKDLSPKSIKAIEDHPWLGNVRELENKVKRALIMAEGKRIEPADLELEVLNDSEILTLKEVRELAEANAVRQALIHCEGSVGRAADLLGASRPTVYHLIKKFNLNV